jgi:four helix bundle protein
MQYKRFEDLPVWRDAAGLASLTFEFTALDQFRRHAGLRDQLERAAFSVSNNIAEGFERGTTMNFSPSRKSCWRSRRL